MTDNIQNIQDHESPVRKMVSTAQDASYEAIETLEKAKSVKNSYLIMDGDDGGQIYLVCPISLVRCSEQILKGLLKELDEKAWNDISMASLFYEIHEPGRVVSGGMGGGIAENNLWVHKNFDAMKSDIMKVLNGESASLNSR